MKYAESEKKYAGLRENGVKYVKIAFQNGSQSKNFLKSLQWEKLMTQTYELVQHDMSSCPVCAD